MVLSAQAPSGAVSGAGAGGSAEPTYGVVVKQILEDQGAPRLEYDPGHPDANADGMVSYPNINPTDEMVNLTEASRAYEANIAVVRAAKAMATSALEILRVT